MADIIARIADDSRLAQRGAMATVRQTAGGADAGAPRPAHATPSSVRRSAAIWSGIGFLAGTLFWSAAGTGPGWGRPEPAAAPASPEKLVERLPATAASDQAAGSTCIALVLDRTERQIRSALCPAGESSLHQAQSHGRQDLLPSGQQAEGAHHR